MSQRHPGDRVCGFEPRLVGRSVGPEAPGHHGPPGHQDDSSIFVACEPSPHDSGGAGVRVAALLRCTPLENAHELVPSPRTSPMRDRKRRGAEATDVGQDEGVAALGPGPVQGTARGHRAPCAVAVQIQGEAGFLDLADAATVRDALGDGGRTDDAAGIVESRARRGAVVLGAADHEKDRDNQGGRDADHVAGILPRGTATLLGSRCGSSRAHRDPLVGPRPRVS
jgi:hypothetical protein